MTRAAALTARLRRVRLLVCDVDGVLTDGTIVLDALGRESKVFSVQDGAGLVLARLAGLRTAFLSGRRSGAIRHRARDCRVNWVAEGVLVKAPAFARMCRRAGVPESAAAYVGDDLIDLPALARAGLAVAVANAAPEVKRRAHWVTCASGGRGAVREIVERVLRAQDRWEPALRRYLHGDAAKT